MKREKTTNIELAHLKTLKNVPQTCLKTDITRFYELEQ